MLQPSIFTQSKVKKRVSWSKLYFIQLYIFFIVIIIIIIISPIEKEKVVIFIVGPLAGIVNRDRSALYLARRSLRWAVDGDLGRPANPTISDVSVALSENLEFSPA